MVLIEEELMDLSLAFRGLSDEDGDEVEKDVDDLEDGDEDDDDADDDGSAPEEEKGDGDLME